MTQLRRGAALQASDEGSVLRGWYGLELRLAIGWVGSMPEVPCQRLQSTQHMSFVENMVGPVSLFLGMFLQAGSQSSPVQVTIINKSTLAADAPCIRRVKQWQCCVRKQPAGRQRPEQPGGWGALTTQPASWTSYNTCCMCVQRHAVLLLYHIIESAFSYPILLLVSYQVYTRSRITCILSIIIEIEYANHPPTET